MLFSVQAWKRLGLILEEEEHEEQEEEDEEEEESLRIGKAMGRLGKKG